MTEEEENAGMVPMKTELPEQPEDKNSLRRNIDRTFYVMGIPPHKQSWQETQQDADTFVEQIRNRTERNLSFVPEDDTVKPNVIVEAKPGGRSA